MNKINPQPMIEREAQNAGTVATDRQGETPERSGRNVPREIPGFPRRGVAFRPAVDSEHEPYFIDDAANRPPDAALPPVDAAFLEDGTLLVVDKLDALEGKVRAEIARRDKLEALLRAERAVLIGQRDSLLEQVKELERQRANLERHLTSAVTYWQTKWASSRRTIKLLILIGGGVMAAETLALAGLIWSLIP